MDCRLRTHTHTLLAVRKKKQVTYSRNGRLSIHLSEIMIDTSIHEVVGCVHVKETNPSEAY